jgi:hypothetical protein
MPRKRRVLVNALIKPAAQVQKATALGHLAVHYRPGEAQLAARFFELIGARVKSFGPFPNGDYFYLIALNSTAPDQAEDIVFLSAMTPQQYELEQELSAHLGIGTQQLHPKLQAFFAEKVRQPEFFLHFGFHFARLEDLEAAVQRLDAAMRSDPAFGARFQGVQILKARGEANDTEIPARMAASPVFSKSDSYAFGRNITQVHIRTDLFAAGLSFLGAVVELDFTFTGAQRPRNPFNDLIMD